MSSKAARTRSEPVTLPRLGLAGTLRWIWTQLTSMSTALMLLLLLAVAAVPGSLVPQRRAGPEIVDQWIEDNPVWGPVLDALAADARAKAKARGGKNPFMFVDRKSVV